MNIGGHYECELPNGKMLRFTVVGELTIGMDIWVVEDSALDLNGKHWMFGKGSWIEKNSIQVPYL